MDADAKSLFLYLAKYSIEFKEGEIKVKIQRTSNEVALYVFKGVTGCFLDLCHDEFEEPEVIELIGESGTYILEHWAEDQLMLRIEYVSCEIENGSGIVI